MAILEDIHKVFVNYYGENNVDLQRYNTQRIKLDYSSSYSDDVYVIIVHWPTVTITNEFDESIEIWDLYGLTLLNTSGTFIKGPQFIRSTYDKVQWDSNYLHSHVSSIGKHELKRWHNCCLGSGPILNTISKLENDGTDLDIWNLYCWELDKYVQVESLTGVPYNKLSKVGDYTASRGAKEFKLIATIPNIFSYLKSNYRNGFLKYLLSKNVLKFKYSYNRYCLASSFVDTVLDISNAFIEYYNNSPEFRKAHDKSWLYNHNVIRTKVLMDDIFYDEGSQDAPIECYIGEPLFTFKGKLVTLNIKDFNKTYEVNKVTLLDLRIISYILYKLLEYINLQYGKQSISPNERLQYI